jgi:hypothetical protein
MIICTPSTTYNDAVKRSELALGGGEGERALLKTKVILVATQMREVPAWDGNLNQPRTMLQMRHGDWWEVALHPTNALEHGCD